MWLVDHSRPDPAENLALDEALLEACETGVMGESLRFWEPASPFVVLGYANTLATEVNRNACEHDGIPILRRCSGGGTVLQLPGALNFNLVLHIQDSGPLSTITGTNRYVMDKMRSAFNALPGLDDRITVRGTTDLCLDNRKFGGNAQRRKRRALVFHGSLLLNASLDLIERYLAFPSRQPDYREGRSHLDFLTSLGHPSKMVKERISTEWGVKGPSIDFPTEIYENLLRNRYRNPEWHQKF